eukprot:TRINITY_DN27525_c0_g1_i1.p1 TRINITY_DN27525_c0_g1~~TRINITY_DN27525_c0_g1_i1.p1  ORF type:complete len:294 (+),score=49.26 TRINITY_DN27525_c0_g1_i1:118-999(+)
MGGAGGGKEAARIAWRQKSGTVGALLDHGSPKPVRDHARANVRALRELHRQLKNRRLAEEEAASRPGFRLKQFENIPSRFQQTPPRTPPRCRSSSVPVSPAGFGSCVSRGLTPPKPSPQPSPQPMARSPLGKPAGAQRRASGSCAAPRARRSPGAESTDAFEIEDDAWCDRTIDVSELERAAARLQRGGAAESRQQFRPESRVPFANDAQDDMQGNGGVFVPPGYRLMPEEERVETLEGLKQKLLELDERYARLPLRIETEGQRRAQRQLREKIEETNAAVRTLSRPRVIVEI